MQTCNFSDTKNTNPVMLMNMTENIEMKIHNILLKNPIEKRNLANLYIVKFLYELSNDIAERTELNEIIEEIEGIELTASTVRNIKETSSDFVAYTIDGKGLTKQEYIDCILKASDEAHKGIDLISHEEVFAKFDKRFKEYENRLAKKSK